MSLSREISKSEKILIGLLAFIILAAAYYFLVFTPINNRTKEIELAMVAAEDELLLLTEQQGKMQSMEAAVAKVKDEPGVIAAPDYDNMKSVAAMLDTIMAGTEGYSMTFTPLTDKDLEGSIVRRQGKITFLCNTYNQAKDVIRQLHSGPYRNLIGDFVVSGNATATGNQEDATIDNDNAQVDLGIIYYEVK